MIKIVSMSTYKRKTKSQNLFHDELELKVAKYCQENSKYNDYSET